MLGVDLTKDIRSASRLFTPPWKPAAAIVGSGLVVLAFKHFGQGEFALPLWSAIAALVLTFATKWGLRRQAWFWIVMSVFVAAHGAAVAFAVRWENWISVKGFVLLVVLDWLVMILTLGLVGRPMRKHPIAHRTIQRPPPITKERNPK